LVYDTVGSLVTSVSREHDLFNLNKGELWKFIELMFADGYH
jgi:hypothetical protein